MTKAKYVGTVKSLKGKDYDVKWCSTDRIVYVSYAGWENIGKANSDSDAIYKAKSWLVNKGI